MTARQQPRTELGAYLRRRRESTDPASLGLPRGARRVTGLRREEVATFAGVSVDYYTRLEQGRETRPSGQLLAAVSRVLHLNEVERIHLYRLAGVDVSPPAQGLSVTVSPQTRWLLDEWSMNPAFIYNDAQDIVACNALGDALYGGFSEKRNFAQMIFLDSHAAVFYREWERVALDTVGALRQAWGKPAVRPGIQRVVDALTDESDEFANMWSTHAVIGKEHREKRLRHPSVGELTLQYHDFVVPDAPDLHLLVCDAEPGSASKDALQELRSRTPTGKLTARNIPEKGDAAGRADVGSDQTFTRSTIS